MWSSWPGRACLMRQPDQLGYHLDPDPVLPIGQPQHLLHLQAAEPREVSAADPDPGACPHQRR